MVEQLDMLDGVAAAGPSKIVLEAQAAWNEYATRFKWRECRVLDKALRASISRAVEDYGGIAGFRAALAKVAKNKFVQGRVPPTSGHRQFRANIVWFCRAQTIRNVVEDFYDDDGADQEKPSLSRQMAPQDDWARWLRDYGGRRSFWPAHLGPRPEEAGCRAPAAMLDACRQRLGIVVAAPAQETREQRLEAMIASYRRNGYWDRANAIEEDLARAQGRPPVLVPSPEVAQAGSETDDRSWLSLSRRPERRRADVVSAQMAAKMKDVTPPEYDGEPVGDYEFEE